MGSNGLNKQMKFDRYGRITGRGIEWTDYTVNPVGGCFHDCKWVMPDGAVAICYADSTATSLRSDKFYPEGFQHHYWRPELLVAFGKAKPGERVFVGSMADVFGHWVPTEQIQAILDACAAHPLVNFQLLTKNAPRLAQFTFPANVWVGLSAPPSQYMGKSLAPEQQAAYIATGMRHLNAINGGKYQWMSIEPLSFDIAPLLEQWHLDWMVIGAATKGIVTYQPQKVWVDNLLEQAERKGVKVFFKGNLEWPLEYWREEYPRG